LIEGTVGALDGERTGDHEQRAEQGGQPHQTRRHAFEHGVAVEGEGEHHHHDQRERENLIGEHTTTTLDPQILDRDQASRGPHRGERATRLAHDVAPNSRT
jgi:hypothetical protein